MSHDDPNYDGDSWWVARLKRAERIEKAAQAVCKASFDDHACEISVFFLIDELRKVLEEPTTASVEPKEEPYYAFHRLWTWAVGLPGYNKSAWKEVEAALFDLKTRARKPTTVCTCGMPDGASQGHTPGCALPSIRSATTPSPARVPEDTSRLKNPDDEDQS